MKIFYNPFTKRIFNYSQLTCMKILLTTLAFCFGSLYSYSQLNESFTDGDFTNNPTWVGNTTDWTVNSSQQLQSNNTVGNAQYYLSTPNTLATVTQWEWYTKIDFNPSSANYIDVFLTASASDVTNNSTTGYFVRIGNTDDEISLYRKDAAGAITKIIDGTNAILNSSSSTMKIKVIRATGNQWTLFRDLSGTGTTYSAEGSVTDATYTSSAFFSIYVKQSTATFFQKHFFDDIDIRAYAPDVTPPAIQSATATSLNTIDVLFNEPVELASSQAASNYSVNNAVGSPSLVVRDAANTALVHLTFAANFGNGTTNTLTINGVRDLSNNAIVNGTAAFSFYVPMRYDAVIDEIVADVNPVIGLPGEEFIELKNTSGRQINLQGWRLTTTSATSASFPSYVLPADSFLIVTSTAAVAAYASFGRVLGVGSFPALIDAGTTLTLFSKEGLTVHSVSYNTSWYQNSVKSEGGWSLEMIDTKNPCNGAANWTASTNPRGGTPGAKNSVDRANPDQSAPALIRAAAVDNVTVILTFNEGLDSTKAATRGNYSISDGINVPTSATTLGPGFNSVQLKLATPLQTGKVYTVIAINVTDCSGNVIQAMNTTRLGLASPIDSFGIVINEILFNPKSGAVDYVEIYNRSTSVYNLKDLYITNSTSTPKQASIDNVLLFPGDYWVLSDNQGIVKQNYIAKNPDSFSDIASFPSFNDDKGTVVLLNAQGATVDALNYDAKWHFSLLENEEGISLERVDYNKPTQDQNNWHSAASTAGFGTPTYQNSQFRSDLVLNGEITITPKTFSPDNDGTDDFALINFQMAEAGNVANITIFDAQGRPVRNLVKNATLALTGTFRWDGLNDKQAKVSTGPYVIYTDVFNLNGKRRKYKKTVIVASSF